MNFIDLEDGKIIGDTRVLKKMKYEDEDSVLYHKFSTLQESSRFVHLPLMTRIKEEPRSDDYTKKQTSKEVVELLEENKKIKRCALSVKENYER